MEITQKIEHLGIFRQFQHYFISDLVAAGHKRKDWQIFVKFCEKAQKTQITFKSVKKDCKKIFYV